MVVFSFFYQIPLYLLLLLLLFVVHMCCQNSLPIYSRLRFKAWYLLQSGVFHNLNLIFYSDTIIYFWFGRPHIISTSIGISEVCLFFFFESSELQGIFDEVVADLLSLPLFFSFLSFQLRYCSHILEVCSCYCRKGCRGLMMNGLAKWMIYFELIDAAIIVVGLGFTIYWEATSIVLSAIRSGFGIVDD